MTSKAPIKQTSYEVGKGKYFHHIAKQWSEEVFPKSILNLVPENLKKLEQSIQEGKPFTDMQERYYHKFDLLIEDNNVRVIKRRSSSNEPVLEYVALEDSYDFLYKVHQENFHATLDPMLDIISKSYVFDTSLIKTFLKCCDICRKANNKKVNNSFLLLKRNYSPFGVLQVFIQDFTDSCDGYFKYLLMLRDIKTKFVLLRPLMAKCPIEIATELFKIITSFGPPEKILVFSRDMKDLFDQVGKNIQKLGFNSKIIMQLHMGKTPEQLFNEIIECISVWMRETSTAKWALGCHVVQWRLNNKQTLNDKNNQIESPQLLLLGNEPKPS